MGVSERRFFCSGVGFLAAMFLASDYSPVPNFAERVLGEETVVMFDDMYDDPVNASGQATGSEVIMFGFYSLHNPSIGLRCFAMGLIFGVGGLFATFFNAIFLGTAFGYMTTVPHRENFFHFVTAHAPFELTAIVLAAAAGMRLGLLHRRYERAHADPIAGKRGQGGHANDGRFLVVVFFRSTNRGLYLAFTASL